MRLIVDGPRRSPLGAPRACSERGSYNARMIQRTIAALFVMFLAASAYSQDTPTERAAAGEVLKKMDALERSLDVPAIVARLTAPNADRDRVVARTKELMEKELLDLADDLATHPEIGFEEKRAVGK